MAQHVSHDDSVCFTWWLSMFPMMVQFVTYDESACFQRWLSMFLMMAHNFSHWLFNLNHVSNWASASFSWWLSMFSMMAQLVSHDGSADAWVRSLAQTVLFQCFCIIYLIFYFTARGRCFVWQYMYVHCHNNNSIIFLSQKICAQTNTHPSHNITFMLTALACNNSSTPGQLPVVAVVAEVPFIWHSV